MFVMMSTYNLALLLLMCGVINYTECLDCFSCTNAQNVSACQYVITCSSNEHCFTRVDGHGSNALFTLGCRNNQQCTSAKTTEKPLSIIGRDIYGRDMSWRDINGRDISINSNIECDQCCAQNYCNKHMCSHASQVITSPNSQCQDANDNCETFGSSFNLCGDILHAKTICKKWCGLCDLVDGGWSVWASWNSCSVTCASGHKFRYRTCTSPTPASGGFDCVGTPSETDTCLMKSCPVHGGWSQWSSWGTCSEPCGVGLERRDRSCSKPYPGPDGDPCFGDARDDRACFVQACANGNWSAWSEWGNCSASCDGGLMERTRTCDNPAPSTFGKYCVGNGLDKDICNTHGCKVYFTVTTPNGTYIGDQRPMFTKVVENVGNGYNAATAQFLSPISGLYQFSTSFMSTSSSIMLECYFFKNSLRISYIRTAGNSDSYDSASATVNIHLNKGDIFKLSSCNSYWRSYVYHMDSCLFTGVLITPS